AKSPGLSPRSACGSRRTSPASVRPARHPGPPEGIGSFLEASSRRRDRPADALSDLRPRRPIQSPLQYGSGYDHNRTRALRSSAPEYSSQSSPEWSRLKAGSRFGFGDPRSGSRKLRRATRNTLPPASEIDEILDRMPD